MKKIIVAIAAIALMASSAYAAEWNFYGSATVETFWADADNNIGADATDTIAEVDMIGSGSVIGANVVVSDELTGRFEYDSTGVTLRHIYGAWNFGGGTLIVGQTDGAFDTDIFTQVYNDGYAGIGVADTSRAPMVKLVFGGFKVNIEAPVVGTYTAGTVGGAAGPSTTDAEFTIPQINASYTFAMNNVAIEVGGAYQRYEYKDPLLANAVDVDVTSYVVGAQVGGVFGAFGLNAAIYAGQNAANLVTVDSATDSTSTTAARTEGYAYYAANKIYDAEVFGFALNGSYAINEMFSLTAGYGYVESTTDPLAGATSIDDEAATYYINMPITLAPGVVLTPEFGVVDYEENLNTEDNITYFGARWAISF